METDLEDYLDGIDDDTLADLQEIRDTDRAASALRQVGRLEDAVAKRRQQALRAKNNIDLWEQTENAADLERLKILRAQLEDFAREQRKNDPRQKTQTTPYGIIKTRDKQAEWVIEDEAALLKWAMVNDNGIIKTTNTLKLQELKKTYQVKDGQAVHPFTGEVAPGVRIVKSEDFTVNIHPSN